MGESFVLNPGLGRVGQPRALEEEGWQREQL